MLFLSPQSRDADTRAGNSLLSATSTRTLDFAALYKVQRVISSSAHSDPPLA